jgi:hypothetical protein
MNVGKVIAKTAGLAGLAMISYDAHTEGKRQSSVSQYSSKADSLADSYYNTMQQDTPSTIVSKYKKWLFNMNTDETISGFFTGIGGYFKGFFNMAAQNVVPLALSLGTLAKSSLIAKGSALGLLGYALIYGIQNSGFSSEGKF